MNDLSFRYARALSCAALIASSACREQRAGSADSSLGRSPTPATSVTASETTQPLRSEPARLSAAAPEAPASRDPRERFVPGNPPSQRVAFSRYRLAVLAGEELSIRRLADLAEVARIEVPETRNVAALTGGGFIAAGRDHVFRVSGIERRAERLLRAPRLGPMTLIPSSQNSAQFWLHYVGVPRLSRFDLEHPSISAMLVALDAIELEGFDGGALLGEGDGAVIYSSAGGLTRIDAFAGVQAFARPDLAGRVWALATGPRRDRVWVATPHHADLIEVRGRAETLERLELPGHPVALAASGQTLAVLSVERVGEATVDLRLDVHTLGAAEQKVLRFDAVLPGKAEAPSFELDVSPDGQLVAIDAGGLVVYDLQRGRRLLPPVGAESAAPPAQNLAPTPP